MPDNDPEPLMEAIRRAASILPEYYQINICVENGAAWVEMDCPDPVDFEPCHDISYAAQINDAIEFALKRETEVVEEKNHA